MSVQLWKLLKRNKIPLKGTQWSIVGYSRCARNTFIYIPELNIALDAGLATDVYPTHIFVTHAHMDHIGELFRYVIDPPNKLVPTVFFPRPSKEYIDDYIQSAVSLPVDVKNFVESSIHMTKHNKNAKIQWNPICVSIPKDTPESKSVIFKTLVIKNFKFKIELFKSTHTIATTGYGFIECRSGLKPEYKHLVGNQEFIEELKNQGTEISCEYEYPHFCYLGDTDHKILYENDGSWNRHLEKYSTIIIECTFLEDIEAKQAKDKKHVLFSRILPFIKAHQNINFILCHFSMKYKDKEIIDFFNKVNLQNIIPFVTDFDKLQTDSVCDLLKSNDEYTKNSVIQILKTQGYEINAPQNLNNDDLENVILCGDCTNYSDCTCYDEKTCYTCDQLLVKCICKNF